MKTNNVLKKSVLILFALIMVFSGTVTIKAATKNDNIISPYYIYINNTSVNLSVSGITATCTSSIRTIQSVKLSIKMELQKEKSNGYETVETWTRSKTGTYLAMSESRNINIFSTYRLKVTFTAGSETETVYKYK